MPAQRHVAALALLSATACGQASAPSSDASFAAVPRAGTAFVYTAVDGSEVSSATTRGRATAVVYLTTFDLASQLMAKRIDAVLRRHVPRANGAAIVLEPPKYVVMAQAFKNALGLSYPVAMAEEWRERITPFGHIDRVPTTIIVDRSGVEVRRFVGVAAEADLEQALASASKRGFSLSP